jgi:hypothetical protein
MKNSGTKGSPKKKAPTTRSKSGGTIQANLTKSDVERGPRDQDDRPEALRLLANIKTTLPDLKDLRARATHDSTDAVYRFYHQSFKMYGLQSLTSEIVVALRKLAPTSKQSLHGWFEEIVAAGTGKQWTQADNAVWTKVTRPIVEAFFHARYFLDVAIESGETLRAPPLLLPSGWAAVLYLYDLR